MLGTYESSKVVLRQTDRPSEESCNPVSKQGKIIIRCVSKNRYYDFT